MSWNSILTNWRTSAAGLIAFLFTVPSFLAAIKAWAAGSSANWKDVLVNVAIAAVGAGLVAAKDGATHSTQTEIAQSTAAVKTTS